MAYAILRAKKLKSLAAVSRSGMHTFRERPTPNANPDMTGKNHSKGAHSASELVASLECALPAKRRKDAVLAIEYLVTASPEAFKRHGGTMGEFGDGYFNDALKWFRKRHGPENVLCFAVHLDEVTPHLVVYVVPKTPDWRLSCRDFLGNPKLLSAMQDDFYLHCGAKHGLERGVVGSKAKHEEVKAFYTSLVMHGKAPELARSDYAAAAMGVKTKAWLEAEEVVKSNATGALRARRTRKSSLSRSMAIERRSVELDEMGKQLDQQKARLARQSNDLESRSRELQDREEAIRRREVNTMRVQTENEAIRRLLQTTLHKYAAAKPRHGYSTSRLPEG